ncbi:MAG: hypothetical protein AVDCRST_MAG52-612, partial [uncultured Blastococcus sp.]
RARGVAEDRPLRPAAVQPPQERQDGRPVGTEHQAAARVDPADPDGAVTVAQQGSGGRQEGVDGVGHRGSVAAERRRCCRRPQVLDDERRRPRGDAAVGTCWFSSGLAPVQALPRIRFILVPHTGQGPCAMRRPDSLTLTSPSKSRFSLHFTQ